LTDIQVLGRLYT